MKMSKVAKAIKDISSLKENNLRKLQEADESDYIDSQTDIEMGSSNNTVIPNASFEDISTQIFESTTNSVKIIPQKYLIQLIHQKLILRKKKLILSQKI